MERSLDQAVVNSFLRGLPYPTSREELVDLATLNNVPPELLDALRRIPDRKYWSQQEVVEQLRADGRHPT
jgi:hypothetical protein